MVESRGDGRGAVVGDGGRYAAGVGDLAPAGEYLPALCLRPVGGGVAQEKRSRGCNRRALRRRQRPGVPVPGGSRSFSERVQGTTGEIRVGTAPREDTSDRVRAICRIEPKTERERQTG